MNTRFKSSLNRIKADEALILQTEEYLRNTLATGLGPQSTGIKKWRMMTMKKLLIAASAAIVLLGGGATTYFTPLSYVSVDINPSVELGVNLYGHVVRAEGYNADGQKVLKGIKVTGMNVSNAVCAVIDSASDNGFIADDGSTVISLTAETDNTTEAADLNAKAEAGTKQSLTQKCKSAEVLKDNVALARREQAREMGLTPGKLNLIQKLQALDPTATVEQYKDAKVKEIMKAIQSHNKNRAGSDNQNPNAGSGNQNPNAGQGNQNPNAGQANQNPNAGQGNQNPNAGQGNQNPNAGSGNQNPNAGQGNQNPNAGSGNQNPNAGGR